MKRHQPVPTKAQMAFEVDLASEWEDQDDINNELSINFINQTHMKAVAQEFKSFLNFDL